MKRLALFLTLLLLLALPTGAALAASPFDIIVEDGEVHEGDVTVFGDEMELHAGGEIHGSVTVFGGSADIAGLITGDLAVFGGNVTISGAVEGDLVTFGGNVTIEESAAVDGDCVVLGGNVEDFGASASCATIGGNVMLPDFFGFGPVMPEQPVLPTQPVLPEMPELPAMPEMPEIPAPPIAEAPPAAPSYAARFGAFVLNLGGVLGRSLLAGFVAFLLAVFMPLQLRRASDVVRRKPAASGAVGLLTAVAGPSLLVLLLLLSALLTIVCIGLLGFPIVIVLAVILFAAAVFGWVAVGNILGEAIAGGLFKMKGHTLALTATIGTALLTLILSLLGLARFFPGEGLVAFIFLCVGLGATALTQFGTKPYPPAEDDTPRSKFDATQAAAGD